MKKALCTGILICLFTAVSFQATAQCTAGDTSSTLYEVSAKGGSPKSLTKNFSFVRSDDTSVLVRLRDINPFAFKCTVSTASQPFKETAISGFLGQIGGVANVGASTPDAAKPTPTPAIQAVRPENAAPNCPKLYSDTHSQVEKLQKLRDEINKALQDTLKDEKDFLKRFRGELLELRTSTTCSDIAGKGTHLANLSTFEIKHSELPSEAGTTTPPIPLDQAIDQIARQAQVLLPHLTRGLNEDCQRELQSSIDQDSAFLTAIAHGTAAVPAAADQWRKQLEDLNTILSKVSNAQTKVAGILADPKNFIIDMEIQGNQKAVTVTISCTSVPMADIATDPPSATAKTDSNTARTALPTSPKNSEDTEPWSREFRFGAGPRFVYAGGLVVSPLQQLSFSTSTNPAPTGSGAPANIVTLQQNSGTRILPIAMLHARYWDQMPSTLFNHWLPNYLSAGITAKPSDNKGTSIEYLFGISWGLAERQIFITSGAYAGQQQRLGDSLVPNQATNLSSANLPITQSTIWKAGFAITWAPGGK